MREDVTSATERRTNRRRDRNARAVGVYSREIGIETEDTKSIAEEGLMLKDTTAGRGCGVSNLRAALGVGPVRRLLIACSFFSANIGALFHTDQFITERSVGEAGTAWQDVASFAFAAAGGWNIDASRCNTKNTATVHQLTVFLREPRAFCDNSGKHRCRTPL